MNYYILVKSIIYIIKITNIMEKQLFKWRVFCIIPYIFTAISVRVSEVDRNEDSHVYDEPLYYFPHTEAKSLI